MDLWCLFYLFLLIVGIALILAFFTSYEYIDEADVVKFDFFGKIKYEGKAIYLLPLIGLVLIVISGYLLFFSKSCFEKKDVIPTNSNQSNSSINSNINITIIVEIVQNLNIGIDTDDYKTTKLPTKEKVQGDKGCYYLIDLKDARKPPEIILFDAGKYTKAELDRVTLNSLEKVNKEIFYKLKTDNISYKIFVIGSADIAGDTKTYIDELIENNSLEIKYLIKNPNNSEQYLQEYKTQVIPKKYANKHLPNLRASYVQEKLKNLDIYSEILDGSVTQNLNEQERNAAIILYLPVEVCK
ncbi:MAG TPA: hypothetical protein PKE69_09345 [Pyrinomonadaceae bacterium]|nr:hypothetical protein [Pyrinomonadaceae bacterium]